jgi:hypothetical protein
MRDDGPVHLSPVIGHPTCDLERQRRVLEARREDAALQVARASGRRTLLDRILRRPARTPRPLDTAALAMPAEDVWHSLRF